MKKTIEKMTWMLAMAFALLIQIPCVHASDVQNQEEKEAKKISIQNEYAEIQTPLTVEVIGLDEDLTYTWTVNGVVKGSEATYTPKAEDLEKWIQVTVDNGIDTISDQIFFSKLPVVYIDTENQAPIVSKDTYIQASLSIQGNATFNFATTTLYEGATEIKGRGNSTWGLPKKPYKLKLDKKADLFGFGKNKHWVLLANYYDTSYMRNKLAYDLSGAMGMPYMQSVLIDVVLNGQYVGNYQLCEQIRVDKNRVNILNWEEEAKTIAETIAAAHSFSKDDEDAFSKQMEENFAWVTKNQVEFKGVTYTIRDYYDVKDIDGGYLLELDSNMDEVSKFTTNKQQPIMFKSPEYVNTNNEMFTYVKEYIQAFEDAVYADDYTAMYQGERKHYSELFDMDALVDYWIINEIFFNEDAMKKSTYLYKDNKELFKMGPVWDMDWSSGAAQSAATPTDQWHTLYFSMNAQQWQWYKELVKDPYFLKQVQNRYWKIRHTLIQNMLNSINPLSQEISESAQASMDAWGQGNYDQKVQELKDWFTKRMAFLDSKLQSYETLAREFHVLNNDKDFNITYEDGTTLSADALSHASVRYQAMADSDRKLIVSLPAQNSKRAQLWVNGTMWKETEVENDMISFEVDGWEEDGVIQVYGYDASGVNTVQGAMAVKSNALQAIEVTPPKKTDFFQNETLMFDDVEVYALYADGSKRAINATINDVNKEIGTQTVLVTYQDYQATFDITIHAPEVINIFIEQMPNKTEYERNEPFDPSGMRVIASYNDNTSKEIHDYTVSPITDAIGKQTITITYQGKTVQLEITVNKRADDQYNEDPDQPDDTNKPSKPQEPGNTEEPGDFLDHINSDTQKPTDSIGQTSQPKRDILVNTSAQAGNPFSFILWICLLGVSFWISYNAIGNEHL